MYNESDKNKRRQDLIDRLIDGQLIQGEGTELANLQDQILKATKTKNLATVIRKELAQDHTLAEAIETEIVNASVAEEIVRIRLAAKLTQAELAAKIGMHQSVITRLEDADYDDCTYQTLAKIAQVLGKRLSIQFSDTTL